MSLDATAPCRAKLTLRRERTREAASGLLLATDVADYLVAPRRALPAGPRNGRRDGARTAAAGPRLRRALAGRVARLARTFGDDVRDAVTPEASVRAQAHAAVDVPRRGRRRAGRDAHVARARGPDRAVGRSPNAVRILAGPSASLLHSPHPSWAARGSRSRRDLAPRAGLCVPRTAFRKALWGDRMQQRRFRPGDVVDDYCPRERRLTDHAIVAMIDDTIKQTRCVSCDAEHEYKEARVPAPRKKRARRRAPPPRCSPHDPGAARGGGRRGSRRRRGGRAVSAALPNLVAPPPPPNPSVAEAPPVADVRRACQTEGPEESALPMIARRRGDALIAPLAPSADRAGRARSDAPHAPAPGVHDAAAGCPAGRLAGAAGARARARAAGPDFGPMRSGQGSHGRTGPGREAPGARRAGRQPGTGPGVRAWPGRARQPPRRLRPGRRPTRRRAGGTAVAAAAAARRANGLTHAKPAGQDRTDRRRRQQALASPGRSPGPPPPKARALVLTYQGRFEEHVANSPRR